MAAVADFGERESDAALARAGAIEVEPSSSGVSWAAVAAGAAANLAVTLAALVLGVGLGLSVASPWSASLSVTTFKLATGVYFIVMAMLGSSIGGYIAGRLRTKWTGVHTDEVYFRDTAHGFLSWAAAAIVGVVLLSGPALLIAGGAASSGASKAAASRYASALLQTDTPANNGQDLDRAHAQLADDLGIAAAQSVAPTPAERAYIRNIVVTRTGLSPADADKRVSDVETQMKSDADAARKAAASLALWLTAAMLMGAFCASLAATEGGGLRDGTWGRRGVRTAR